MNDETMDGQQNQDGTEPTAANEPDSNEMNQGDETAVASTSDGVPSGEQVTASEDDTSYEEDDSGSQVIEPEHAAVAAPANGKKPRKKLSKRAVIGIVAVAAIALVACIAAGVQAENERQAAEAAAQAEAQRQQEKADHDSYVNNLSMVRYYMVAAGAQAESACNLTLRVWRAAIWDHSESEWDDDIKPYFSTDFNEALSKMYQSSTYQDYVTTINSYDDRVEQYMRDLTNPPDDCEQAYDTLTTLYTKYSKLTGLATSPSGSYQTYSSEFRSADSDFMDSYNLLGTQIPDIASDDSGQSS